MLTQTVHPSVEKLTAFSVGQLSSAEAETVESHIGECTPCCETLMGLTADDTFVGLLKDAGDLANDLSTVSGLGRAALAGHPRYEILEQIAKGGMGEVFKAKHRVMDRTVALKFINNELMRNPVAVERFQREVKTAAQLSHANIVTAYDAEQADGVHFLVMEYVDGVNLAEHVKTTGVLSVADGCDYVRQAAIGLQYAHEQGAVHRDIKPHNLMLTPDDTIKILDFGLASLESHSVSSGDTGQPEGCSLTSAGVIMGTPDFISPEQAADAHQADIRSDIYSLGASLHYLLSGQPPFTEGSVAERLRSHAETEPVSVTSLRDDVPQELSDVISRMMAKEPDQRLQTPQEVADALAPFIDRDRNVATTEAAPLIDGRNLWWTPSKLTTAMACAAIGLVLAGIIYLETDKGTLEIVSVDDRVNVTISKAEGSDGDSYLKLSVVDTVTGSKVRSLPSGDYKVSLGKAGNEFELSQGGFTLTRGGDVVVKVTRKERDAVMVTSEPLRQVSIPRMAQHSLMMQGRRLSPEDARGLQVKADGDPDDLESRLQLLPYYGRKSILAAESRKPHSELVAWLVNHYPQADAAGDPAAHIHASINPNGYLKVKKLWLAKVDGYPRNTKILSNAAKFFLQSDRSVAEELLKKAQVIEPENADWSGQLGQLYKLGLIRVSGKRRQKQATKALEQLELAMSHNKMPQMESSLLVSVTTVAFDAGAFEKAEAYANQLLEVGGNGEQDWNSGNAIHHANLILGRLALKAGNIKEAGSYLLAAGKTSGSPQLNSFGANMLLAKELLEQGEQSIVLEYFKRCSRFWETDKLEQWAATVRGGGIPEFGGNLLY